MAMPLLSLMMGYDRSQKYSLSTMNVQSQYCIPFAVLDRWESILMASFDTFSKLERTVKWVVPMR